MTPSRHDSTLALAARYVGDNTNMKRPRLRKALALTVTLGLLGAFLWAYIFRCDRPIQWTISGADLQWKRGLLRTGPVGTVHLDANDARQLARLISKGPSTLSGTVSCPMDSENVIRTHFSNSLFRYPSFTIKLSGCSGTFAHQMTPQLSSFLDHHEPPNRGRK